MDDMRVAAAFRAIRIRRRLRQSDVAERAGVHRSTVSRLERGHFGSLPLNTVREIASILDMRVELLPRWRGSDLDRLLNASHSALHESVSRFFRSMAGWEIAPEVSFSIYGERGVIDILAWHAASRSLLVIELKTAIVDVQDLVGTFDRKMRLAARVARERGWEPLTVSGWIVVAATRTNRRRVDEHSSMLRSAFRSGGPAVRAWLRSPSGRVTALSFWTDAHPGHVSRVTGAPTRVRRAQLRLSERGDQAEAGPKDNPAAA